MQRDGRRWKCLACGAEVDGVPLDADVSFTIHARSGEPNVRVVLVDGKEVHRCTTS
jgi:hypothetical protein